MKMILQANLGLGRAVSSGDNFLCLRECLPPVIRDRRWFYRLVLKVYNPRMDPDFKVKAPNMNDQEFRQAYEALVPTRATNLTARGFEFVTANVVGKTVLEVGCEKGDVSLACARAGFDVTATDLAEGNLQQVRAKAESLNVNLRTEVANVEELRFPETSFDTVIYIHTVEHVLNLPAAVSELKRVARRRLIVVVQRERYYRYTCNYHLHFFGGPEQLMLLFGLQDARCEVIGGELHYVGNLDSASTRKVPA